MNIKLSIDFGRVLFFFGVVIFATWVAGKLGLNAFLTTCAFLMAWAVVEWAVNIPKRRDAQREQRESAAYEARLRHYATQEAEMEYGKSKPKRIYNPEMWDENAVYSDEDEQ